MNISMGWERNIGGNVEGDEGVKSIKIGKNGGDGTVLT
jgi:hypothetical protein